MPVSVVCKWCKKKKTKHNLIAPVQNKRTSEILLPSAVHLEERLTVSQSVT